MHLNEEPRLKSANSFEFVFVILLLGGIGACCVSYYLICDGLQDAYPQIWPIGLGLFFGGFGVTALFALLTLDTILIYKDRFEVRSILGYQKKTIYLQDISGWMELEKRGKNEMNYELVIYTDRTKYKVHSTIYMNYFQLKAALTKGKPNSVKAGRKHEVLKGWLSVTAFAAIAFICLYTSWHFSETGDEVVTEHDLVLFEDVITNTAEISKGSKGARSVSIQLKHYPDFVFRISGATYSAMHAADYVQKVNTGDTLLVGISRHDYETKLVKTKEPGFWDKTVNYRFIPVYDLSWRDQSFLLLADFNSHLRSDRAVGVWIFGIIGVVCLFTAVGMLFVYLTKR